MVQLNNYKFYYSSLGAGLTIGGVVLKNTLEQMSDTGFSIGKSLGLFAFVVGWMITAYSISINNEGLFQLNLKSLLGMVAAIGVVFAVIQMNRMDTDIQEENSKTTTALLIKILFVGSWLLLGVAVGIKKPRMSTWFGIIAATMVVISMGLLMPWQRKNNIVDGPGLPIFVIGWVFLILANSMRTVEAGVKMPGQITIGPVTTPSVNTGVKAPNKGI